MVAGDPITDDHRFFSKISRDGNREATNMLHARRTLGLRKGSRDLRVPLPLRSDVHHLTQERLVGFQSLDGHWLRNPALAARCCVEVLLSVSTLSKEGVSWKASPEVKNVSIELIHNANLLHHLAQKALNDRVICKVVAEPVPTPPPETFVHGDLKPDNLMIVSDGSSLAIVDWENAGVGNSDCDAASLIAGLIYVSVRSTVRRDGTEWDELRKFLNHIETVRSAWLAESQNSEAFRILLAKYLFIRLCGHYSELEQEDRCAFILKKFITAL